MKKSANSELLSTLGIGLAGGAGAAAIYKLLNILKNRKSSGRVVDMDRDYGSPGLGAIPVYVDMTPEEAAKYESITGKKVAAYTPRDTLVKLAYTGKIASDYNWLAHGAVGTLGGYVGYKVIKSLIDSINKRNQNRRMEDVKKELADLYAASALDDKNAEQLPTVKKLGALKNILDAGYEAFANKELLHKELLKANMSKTAGIVGDITALPFEGIKQTGSSMLATLAPVIATFLLMGGVSSYLANRGSAGKRDELKAYRKSLTRETPEPYVELRPRLKQKAQSQDPSPVEV